MQRLLSSLLLLTCRDGTRDDKELDSGASAAVLKNYDDQRGLVMDVVDLKSQKFSYRMVT